MAETSSRPVKAKAICDQKLTVSQFHAGNMLCTVKCVTDPWRRCRPDGDDDEDGKGQVSADAAGVLQPLADVEADDVQPDGNEEKAERDCELEGSILSEAGAAGAEDVGGHGGAGEQQAGEIEDGVDPVGPAGDEAVEGTEGFFGPDVEAAFFREARRKLVDDESARNEKENGGEDPEADRGGAVVAGGGDPARAEDGGDVEEQHVPEAHGFAQLRFGSVGGDGHHGLAAEAR